MTIKPFKPTVPENLNRPYNVTLTEGEISTILYYLDEVAEEIGESYIPSLEVKSIYSKLEGAVDSFYDNSAADEVQQCIADGTDYRDCVDHLVDSMEKSNEVKKLPCNDLRYIPPNPYKATLKDKPKFPERY